MQEDIKHFASPSFWMCYEKLPADVQKLADKNFEVLKTNSKHPSLHFKKVGKYYSVRVGMKYRSLGVEIEDGILWFWIGTHSEYENLFHKNGITVNALEYMDSGGCFDFK